ncbi:DUF3810 domain-containing protein [Flavobacterium crassostreae]|uniref:DUF3810 domain-containing protein n=1 Tax=Flavobacterium crassostreae TaxID=1763534 RepID=UPI001E451468|nr:DUF3810 domain-containing protein [Flavobacterium crassostreae]
MKSKYFFSVFLLIQIAALQLLSYYPKFVEQYYSIGIYPHVALFLRKCYGLLGFSVGDCLYIGLFCFVLYWFWTQRKQWHTRWQENGLKILGFWSVGYFWFHALWALNYYREPLFEKMNINKEYTPTELLVFTNKIILKTNNLHKLLNSNPNLKVVYPYSEEQTFAKALNGYQKAAVVYTGFEFLTLSTKKSLVSLPLSYMGFSGYLNPFTNEAQLNYLIPKYGLPATVTHEMAHQIGYASESECNFIGFMAAIQNEDLYFKYSGYTLALKYCLSQIRAQDPVAHSALLKTITPGILKNFEENQQFQKQYQSYIQTAFEVFYDQYLKANQQKEGIDSYSKFVGLLVNYYKTKPLS